MAKALSPAVDDSELVRQIVNISYFLCFFPSLIYAIAPTQTQPIAAVIALPLLFLRPVRLSDITLPCFALMAVATAYTIGSLLIYPQNAGSIIGTGCGYLAVLVLFIAFYDKMHLLSPKPLAWSVGIWAAIGSIQAMPFPGFIKAPVQAVGRLMLERFVAGQYEESRGYSLLASEPSMSAPTVILMLLSVWFFLRRGQLSRASAATIFLAVAYLIYLNRSGSIAILLVLILLAASIGALVKASWGQRLAVLVLSIGMVAGLVTLGLKFQGKGIRMFDVIGAIVSTNVTSESFDAMRLLVTLGAQRIIPTALAYGALPQHYGVGHGVASWNINGVMNSVKSYVGIDYAEYNNFLGNELAKGENHKPQSFASLIAFDMGFVGMVPFLWLLGAIAFYRRSLFGPRGDNRLIYIVPACVWLALLPLAVLPMPWLLLLYSIQIAREEEAPVRQGLPRPAPSRPRLAIAPGQ